MTTTLTIPDDALTISGTTPFVALTISLRTSLPALTASGGVANRRVCAEALRLGLSASVAPIWLYCNLSGHPDDDFDLEIALPLGSPILATPRNPFAIRAIPSFRCAQYRYTGSWSNFSAVYDALFQQFYAADLVYDGRVREIYRVVDFDNPDNCVTDLQIGIA